MSIDSVMFGMPINGKIIIVILVITGATLAWNIDDKIIIFVIIIPFVSAEMKARRTGDQNQRTEVKSLYSFHIDYILL